VNESKNEELETLIGKLANQRNIALAEIDRLKAEIAKLRSERDAAVQYAASFCAKVEGFLGDAGGKAVLDISIMRRGGTPNGR
jgi:hypothetical protein